MALVIGVTGSIASGKSLVCDTLVGLGAEHCDADKLVHRMYDPGKPAFDRIVGIFGKGIIGQDGYIDRRILGSKVFGQPEEMARLTRAIGDIGLEVKGVIDTWRSELSRQGTAIMEAVNLIEAGYGRWCDQVWLIACTDLLAKERLMARNGFSNEEADQRLRSQQPWQKRAPASDLVLHNNDSSQELIRKVYIEYQQIHDLYSQGQLPVSKYIDWWQKHD